MEWLWGRLGYLYFQSGKLTHLTALHTFRQVPSLELLDPAEEPLEWVDRSASRPADSSPFWGGLFDVRVKLRGSLLRHSSRLSLNIEGDSAMIVVDICVTNTKK